MLCLPCFTLIFTYFLCLPHSSGQVFISLNGILYETRDSFLYRAITYKNEINIDIKAYRLYSLMYYIPDLD